MKQKGLAPLVIIILIALAVGGYLLYQKQLKPAAAPQLSPTPIAYDETSTWKTYTSPEYNPFYSEEQLKTEIERLKLNGEKSDQNPNLQNVRFSIKLPNDWNQGYDKKGSDGEQETFGSGFTFINKNLEIRIGRFYAPGGNSCDKDFVGYGNNYKDIQAGNLNFRRVKAYTNISYIPKGYTKFELCAKEGESISENSSLGKITYTLPENYNQSDLELMDKIISTLQKN